QQIYIQPYSPYEATVCYRQSSTERATFNTSTLVATLLGDKFDTASVEDVGNGWFLVTATFISDATTHRFVLSPHGANTTVDAGTNMVGLYGASLKEVL